MTVSFQSQIFFRYEISMMVGFFMRFQRWSGLFHFIQLPDFNDICFIRFVLLFQQLECLSVSVMTQFSFLDELTLLNKTQIYFKSASLHAGSYQTHSALVQDINPLCTDYHNGAAHGQLTLLCVTEREQNTHYTPCVSLGKPPLISLPSVHSLTPFISPLTPRCFLRSAFLHSPLGDYSALTYASTGRGSASLQISHPLISFPSLTFILRFPLPSSPILLV